MLISPNGSICSWRLLVLFMLLDKHDVRLSAHFALSKLEKWLDMPSLLVSSDGLVVASFPSIKQPDFWLFLLICFSKLKGLRNT